MKYSRNSFFFLLLLVLLANALFISADDELAPEAIAEADIDATGGVVLNEKVSIDQGEEEAVESIPEESETVEEEKETETTPVIEEEEEPVESKEEPVKIPSATVTESWIPSESVAFIKDKVTGVVKKVKGLTAQEAKKVAAATLGVWGAATGIKWAMQRGGE